MAALAADRLTRTRAGGSTRMGTADLAANAKIYNGALIAKNAAGYVVPASDTAGLKVIGIALQAGDNTGGADGALSITYLTGVEAELDNAGGAIVQASDHALCTVSDDHSVTTAAVTVNDIVAGRVRRFDAASVWVYVDEEIGAA